jgi:hypothetical protein
MTRAHLDFEIDGNALRRLFRIWNLPLPEEELVLFGLRGSVPLQKPKGWTHRVKLKLMEPDYEHLRCTLGLWNQKTDKIFAARGSTVPHRENVLKAAARKGVMKGRGTNQMEPGFYQDLRKGEHLQGKPMGHAALRQSGYRFYRRSHHAPPYTRRDPLFFGNPYDNFHSSWNLEGSEPGFRSSGCLVMAGLPHCHRLPDSGPNRGAWKIFHDLVYASPQKQFPLLLLPAAEVRAALIEKRGQPRLCYGSQGEAVLELQKGLRRRKFYAGPFNGKLRVATYRAWNRAGFAGNGKRSKGR